MVQHQIIPSARRLVTSLRDMGYDFAQAVADIVDNSIEASATKIDIDVEFDGDNSWVRISDNGRGMNDKQVLEAMRFGSDRDYSDTDLGRFGLGLKTASLSQCRRLTVASRWDPNRPVISGFSWDIDHVVRTNEWEVLPLADTHIDHIARHTLKAGRGTVVVWNQLDRILGYKHPYGDAARKRLAQMTGELERHLAMVFHRFLPGGDASRNVMISLNDNMIEPWDPFCRSESSTQKLQADVRRVEYEGVTASVRLQPYVLPHKDDFSSKTAFDRASGPSGWNQQQGLYIYRANRLIQSGGWSRLRKVDEHTKLARIAVDFPPSLDAAFKVNVAKMRVQLPESIRDDVRKATTPIVKLAKDAYSRKQRLSATQSPSSSSAVPNSTNKTPDHQTSPDQPAKPPSTSPRPPAPPAVPLPSQSHQHTNHADTSQRLTASEWRTWLLSKATPDERVVLLRVLDRVHGMSETEAINEPGG